MVSSLAVLCLCTVQPSTVARYASKVVAAHVGMLQSEALVMQYQRQCVEAELAKLKSSPGFVLSADQQHDKQQLLELDQAAQEDQECPAGNEQHTSQADQDDTCSQVQPLLEMVSAPVPNQCHLLTPYPVDAITQCCVARLCHAAEGRSAWCPHPG